MRDPIPEESKLILETDESHGTLRHASIALV